MDLSRLKSLNDELADLLRSVNGCEYTDIQDGRINVLKVSDSSRLNVIHLNIRSLPKNERQSKAPIG